MTLVYIFIDGFEGMDTMDTIDNTILNEYNEYSNMIDSKFVNFHKNTKNRCMALTQLNLQCKYTHNTGDNHILCTLHRKKKK